MNKKYILLIILILFFLNCTKMKNKNEINIDEKIITITEIEKSNDEKKPIKEIIEFYAINNPLLPSSSAGDRTFAFQIEGNFTNSGNKEIIAFYEYLLYDSISVAFCFIFDKDEEKIDNIYFINYGTLDFDEKIESLTGLSKILGNEIYYKDRIIGYYGDFNQNGRDELYLYSLSGKSLSPNFIEFYYNNFRNILILDENYIFATIFNINYEIKVIDIKFNFNYDSNLQDVIKSYIWNSNLSIYSLFDLNGNVIE